MARSPTFRTSSAASQARHLLAEAQALADAGRIVEAERAMSAAEGVYGRPPHDAEAWTRSPDFLALLRGASTRLGQANLAVGGLLPALGHLAQAVTLGADEAVQDLFISLLSKVRFKAPHALAKSIVQRALEERWIDPGVLGRLAAGLLIVEPGAQGLMRRPEHQMMASALLEAPVAAFLREPLLVKLLDSVIVVDPNLERVLILARQGLLQLVCSNAFESNDGLERFAAALANQGFANEYAWAVAETEEADVESLHAICMKALADGRAPHALELATLAAYRPLRAALDGAALLNLACPDSLAATILRQLREPMAEEAQKGEIPALTEVRDAGSRAVKRQYEENPYPRWVSAPARRKPTPLLPWIHNAFPASADHMEGVSGRHEVLIAGCGTGIETVAFVQTFSDVEVLALDLSLTSLAHAQRRSVELGLVEHLAFVQADLLELEQVGRRFDVVVSAGVLHHLDNPRHGLQALRAATRPGGLLMLAFYSRLGRKMLEPARAYAQEGGFGGSASELRRFRSTIHQMPAPAPVWRDRLLELDDFYSLSSLRDLLFHARETVFDPQGIAAMLETCGLRFLGFQVPPEVDRAFAERFGKRTDRLSFEQWSVFEAERPDTFRHMYYLLVQRPCIEPHD